MEIIARKLNSSNLQAKSYLQGGKNCLTFFELLFQLYHQNRFRLQNEPVHIISHASILTRNQSILTYYNQVTKKIQSWIRMRTFFRSIYKYSYHQLTAWAPPRSSKPSSFHFLCPATEPVPAQNQNPNIKHHSDSSSRPISVESKLTCFNFPVVSIMRPWISKNA